MENDDEVSKSSGTMEDQAREIDQLRQEIEELKGIVSRRDSFIAQLQQLQQQRNAQSKDLVRYVMGNVLDWEKHIPEEWKQDSDFVEHALRYGHTDWKSIPEPCRWHPDVILGALLYDKKMQWNEVPERLQRHDPEIAAYGVNNSHIHPDQCPCLLNRAFIKMEFLNDTLDWQNFPTELKTDIEFARSIEQFPNIYHAHQIFDHFPPLREDRATWVKAVEAGESEWCQLCSVVHDFAPSEIRSDWELMEDACAKDEGVLSEIDASLGSNHTFLLAVARRNGRMVRFLSHEMQRRFLDVVDLALQQFNPGEDPDDAIRAVSAVVETLAPEFWDSRDFALRWFRLGLPFLSQGPFLRPEWRADREIFLLVAKHCRFPLLQASFAGASLVLRGDKKFMLQVLEIQPSLCRHVAPELRNDFDLCLLAFSGEQRAAQIEVSRRQSLRDEQRDRNDEYGYVETFRSQVSGRLNAHKRFSTIVLPAMAQTTDSGCTLAVLNQGAETSRVYKKRVAGYLDVPTGKRLRLHRQAANNLNAVLESGDNDG